MSRTLDTTHTPQGFGPSTAERLPIPARETMNEAQQAVADAIINGPRKAIFGPFVPLLQTPVLMAHIGKTGEALRFHGTLPARIRELESSEREGGDPALIREEIIRTSMAHGITSRFTSLVAVERTPARPEGESLLADQVPNAEPAQTLNLAQGATSARLHLGSALAVLLLGFALFRRAPSFD